MFKGYRGHKSAYLMWLLPPLLVYLLPLMLGFAWNSLSGPIVPGPTVPEGYTGRLPNIPITAESWGTAVVIVPFHARLGEYLRHGDLPLWNPYQGLGQTFTAGGEGGPYFPLAIVRALLPYSWSNWITVLGFGVGGLATVAFLRGLKVTQSTALFGGIAFMVSGALTIHLPRDNIADQFGMVPVLLWATAAAVRERTTRRYVILAGISGLHLLAGFLQIAMLAMMLAGFLTLVYAGHGVPSIRAYVGRTSVAIGAVAIGCALAAFSLLPMLSAMSTAQQPSQNLRIVYFEPSVPRGNGLSFFLPVALGHPYALSWVAPHVQLPSDRPNDWNDLFGYVGLLPLVLVIGGVTTRTWRSSEQKLLFYFFAGAGFVLLLRYLSVPPFSLIDLVPPFAIQTRKHANGITALVFVLAAALALENRDCWRRKVALTLQIMTVLVLFELVVGMILGYAGPDNVDLAKRLATVGVHHLALTVIVGQLVILPFVFFATGDLRSSSLVTVAGALAVGEAVCYLPLGTAAPGYLYARAAIAALLLAGGLLWGAGRPRLATLPVAAALGCYGWLLLEPTAGLPQRFDADRVPRYMRWLQDHAGREYRTFGIFPDLSSIGQIQDLGVVGPLAPRDFQTMINIVSDEHMRRAYAGSPIFMMAGRLDFSFQQLQAARPVFNWLGVRYLVLEKAYTTPPARPDQAILDSDPAAFQVAYEDDRVRIFESVGAGPKAEFWPAVGYVVDHSAIVTMLQEQPGRSAGPPLIEQRDRNTLGLPASDGSDRALPVQVQEYRPNRVSMTVDAPSPGIVVLKDVYSVGWYANVDGQPAPLVRVHGFARGVPVKDAGLHRIEILYWPPGLSVGLLLAAATVVLLVAVLIYGAMRRQSSPPIWAALAGAVIVVLFVAGAARTILMSAQSVAR